MSTDQHTENDVRALLEDLAAPVTAFGPGVVQAIRHTAHRQERLRQGMALGIASAMLLAGGAVAVNVKGSTLPAPPAGRQLLVDWPTHGSGPFVLGSHFSAGTETTPTGTSVIKDITNAWDRDSSHDGHQNVGVLFSDELVGSAHQLIVVVQGLSRTGEARLAVFTSYLPGYQPPGVPADSFQLVTDVATPHTRPQTLLVALNGLARGPVRPNDSWHHDQSALIALTSPAAAPSDVRISLPGSEPRSARLEPRPGYAVFALGTTAIPLEPGPTVLRLVDDTGTRRLHTIGSSSVAGGPSAAVLMSAN